MIYRYEIKNSGKEEILYLYLEMNYEFSKELDKIEKTSNKIKNYIEKCNINYNGNKVYLISNGIIIKAFEFNKENNKQNTSNTDSKYIINLKYENKMISITLKDYLLGVIATNSMDNLELTTLKCLALLYRTYAYKEMKENKLVNASNSFQIYKPISVYKLIWNDKYMEKYNKIEKAIKDTDGEYITHKNELIYPYIHICNNGNTDSSNIPYLKKRISLWDYSSPYYLNIIDYDYNKLSSIFGMKIEELKDIKILEISKSKYIKKIKVGKNIYSGDNFKKMLNLRSSDINIIINPRFARFITKGWGNNLGLSQFGANEIAKIGCSYISILKYYFTDIEIKKNNFQK